MDPIQPPRVARQIEQASRIASRTHDPTKTISADRVDDAPKARACGKRVAARRSRDKIRSACPRAVEQHGRPGGGDGEFWLRAK